MFFMLLGLIGNKMMAGEIKQIKQAIIERGVDWTATENWIMQLPADERKNLLGAIINPSEAELAPMLILPPVESLPPLFDWRVNNGNWITPVKNQANCGSCWDFSAIGQVEAWWKIYHTNLDSMIDLSEQFILSCGNAGSCAGGSAALALEYVKNVGVPSENCLPYYADDTVPCSSACSNWISEAVTIPGWGWITTEEAIIDNIKNAVLIHPLSTYLAVFTDFFSYSGGVYQQTWGNFEGGHLVVIVGWDDSEQSWICKNSWGTNWGEAGFFRIRWGECSIGTWSPFIWDDIAGNAVISVSPSQFDLTLPSGDTTIQSLIIRNQGQNLLEYVATDYGSQKLFHPDTFRAWDSLSWWCGDTTIGGYYNSSLQYLETPPLDLSNTNTPTLSWMGFWALENPIGVFPPYDGWDGCNVWISVNGGETFEVIHPVNPIYDCGCLYSFSNPYGWNLGIVPGWAGQNGTWTPVEFNLSAYKSDSVIIRFAFAADEGLCTLDDTSLVGFFIDDIEVADGSTIIFEDDANDINSMQRLGYGRLIADWIDIPNGVGQLIAGDSMLVEVKFNARNMLAGDYQGWIQIVSNDTGLSAIIVPVNLRVTGTVILNSPAEKMVKHYALRQNYPNPFNPVTTINFNLPKISKVTLKVYNILGEEVATLLSASLLSGSHSVEWNASEFASGVYLYRLQADDYVETRKMVLMR